MYAGRRVPKATSNKIKYATLLQTINRHNVAPNGILGAQLFVINDKAQQGAVRHEDGKLEGLVPLQSEL